MIVGYLHIISVTFGPDEADVGCRRENETIFILAEDAEETVEAEYPSIYDYLLRRALEARFS